MSLSLSTLEVDAFHFWIGVISHDERYFHLADHIIKLDYGAVESEQTVQQSGSL